MLLNEKKHHDLYISTTFMQDHDLSLEVNLLMSHTNFKFGTFCSSRSIDVIAFSIRGIEYDSSGQVMLIFYI